MLMGLQDAPSVFQNINNRALHGLNHRTYLDDSFFGGETFQEALDQRDKGDKQQAKLGFRPNWAKSSKTNPNATIDILGFYRVNGYLYIPEERILRILRLVDSHKYHKAAQTLEYYNPLNPKCATHKWWLANPKTWNPQKRRLLESSLWEARILAYYPPDSPIRVHIDSANNLTAAIVTTTTGQTLHHFSAKLQPSKSSTAQEARGVKAARKGLRHILQLYPNHILITDNKNIASKDPSLKWEPGTSNLADKFTRMTNPERSLSHQSWTSHSSRQSRYNAKQSTLE